MTVLSTQVAYEESKTCFPDIEQQRKVDSLTNFACQHGPCYTDEAAVDGG